MDLPLLISGAAALISAVALALSWKQAQRNKQVHGWVEDDRESGDRRWTVERQPDNPNQVTIRNAGTTTVHNVTIDDGDGHPLEHGTLKSGHIICCEIQPGSLAHPVTIATIYWHVPGEQNHREYQFRD